jgi:hypothetical protein
VFLYSFNQYSYLAKSSQITYAQICDIIEIYSTNRLNGETVLLMRIKLVPGTYYVVIENEFATYSDLTTTGDYSLAIFEYTGCELDAYDETAEGNDSPATATPIILPYDRYAYIELASLHSYTLEYSRFDLMDGVWLNTILKSKKTQICVF